MQFTTLLTTATIMASTALAAVQINYYNDNGCRDYIGQVDVNWATYGGYNCYNYEYGTSANVAGCSESNCECTFYENQGCSGNAVASWFANGGSNCLGGIHSYKSFGCYYNV